MKTIEMLKLYDKLYYETGKSPVSDRQYDDIREQLKKLYPKDPYFKSIGSSPSNKVELPYILGSLDKFKPADYDKLTKKFGRVMCCISEKIDGMSVMVHWKDGKVVFAATRGDGLVGQDITGKMKIICSKINQPDDVILRGELVMIGDSYKELGLKNPRNGVVGIINSDDNDNLDYVIPYFYEVIESSIQSEFMRFRFIEKLGLKTPRYIGADITFADMVLKGWKQDYIGYEIDGVVISPNIYERENVMYPEMKVAYKVNQDAVETTVKHVEWNVSRTGKLVPTVIMEPVDISGTTIQRASGFNALYIKQEGIGTGAKVGIVKSGEIIPYIEYVTVSVDANIPENCPNCAAKTKMVGVDLTCTNINCSERVVFNTAHFLKVMGVEGMSETTLWNLGVRAIQDVYDLQEEDIMEKDGFGYKAAEEIIFQLKKSLNTKPHIFLAALGMPMISIENAKTITDRHSIDDIWTLNESDVGLGPVASQKFKENIMQHYATYMYLKIKGLKFVEERESKMRGLIFTLTGTGNLRRDQYVKMIEDAGASVKSASSKTNYLVAENKNGVSGKLKAARKFGTKIISYNDLENMLDENL